MIILFKGLLFAALLVYAAVSDIRRREVDDWVSVAILIVSLLATGGSFEGALLMAVFFAVPILFKHGSIGGGDIKLMGACGAVLGISGGVIQAIIGLSLAGLYGVFLRVRKGCKLKETQIPLAPFLCAGGIIAYIISIIGGI